MSASSSGRLQWLGFASPCRRQQLRALAFQRAFWGSPAWFCSRLLAVIRACACHSAGFVGPHRWPAPGESVAICCVGRLVSCVTHLRSCAGVGMWSKREEFTRCCWDQGSKLLKLKIARVFCKNLGLLKLKIAGVWHSCGPSTEHGCNTVQRARIAAAIGRCFWLTKRTHRFWRGFLSRAVAWFATDRSVQRRKSGTQLKNFEKQGMTYELLLGIFLAWKYYLVYCTATGV